MSQALCPRCGDVLPSSGSCAICAREPARAGDATRGRIEKLADGWALPVRNDSVGDAHIVREVRSHSEIDVVADNESTARAPSVSSVLAALEQEFDGPGEAAQAVGRLPTLQVTPMSGPRAPTMVADVTQDDIRHEFDDVPPSQATVPPLPPPPPGPPPRRKPQPPPIPASAEAWPPGQLPHPTGTPAPLRTPPRATPADPTLALADGSLVGETETTVFDPRLPVHEDTPPPRPAPARSAAAPVAAKAAAKPTAAPTVARPAPAAPPPIAVRGGGVLGDVRYVFAVVLGLWSGRRELATINERLTLERAGRKRRLAEAARIAVGEVSLTGEELEAARERLVWHEEQRAKYAGAALAADDEARRSDDERAEQQRRSAHRVAELERAVEQLEARLRPLERELAERKKTLETLRVQVAGAGKRIDAVERRLAASKDSGQRAGIEAELAAARAEKLLLAGEEPARQAAVLELGPRIEGELSERKRLLGEMGMTRDAAAHAEAHLGAAAKEARVRAERERVAERGSETARDAELEQLGQALDRDRPEVLRARFRAVDEHGASIAQLERRGKEIELARASIDRLAIARGVALVLLSSALVVLALVLLLR